MRKRNGASFLAAWTGLVLISVWPPGEFASRNGKPPHLSSFMLGLLSRQRV